MRWVMERRADPWGVVRSALHCWGWESVNSEQHPASERRGVSDVMRVRLDVGLKGGDPVLGLLKVL